VSNVAAILDLLDSGSAMLPQFPGGCVRSRARVRNTMRSQLLGYSVGHPLTWDTMSADSLVRGETHRVSRSPSLGR
jgi:hypothetical protein